jgi:entericidin B
MKWAKQVALWLVLVVSGVSLLGCHTVRGAGEDIEHGGEAIQDAAR